MTAGYPKYFRLYCDMHEQICTKVFVSRRDYPVCIGGERSESPRTKPAPCLRRRVWDLLDGREMTVAQIREALPGVKDRTVSQQLTRMKRDGLLTVAKQRWSCRESNPGPPALRVRL